MQIKSYKFGELKLDGSTFTNDLMIAGENVKSNWYRDRGHQLQRQDLDWMVDQNPDVLVIGTGKRGVMSVPSELVESLEQQDIEVHVKKTDRATDLFNELQQRSQQVGGAFHLTC